MSRGLPKKVKTSLNKAIDSALLAVEVYNKPATKFKSGGFVILMIIAWTSLFHAIFFRKKIKPFRKKSNKRYERRDGDYVYWELKECLNEYFKDDQSNPVKVNLELFIPLRNMIEHKSMPEIDSDLFAECQAMLINFDDILAKEFGEKYCIKESLSFSLQLFPSSNQLPSPNTKDSKNVVDFIEKYRSSISHEVIESGQYSFKAFLFQVANHNSKDALPVQFIQYDKLSDEEKKNAKRVAALIKTKNRPVSNVNLMKPGEVVSKVQSALGNPKIANANGELKDKFHMGIHTCCWKYYKVRPRKGSDYPEDTKSEFCVYDTMNKNYGYTQKWVKFLIEKMQDEKEYNKVIHINN